MAVLPSMYVVLKFWKYYDKISLGSWRVQFFWRVKTLFLNPLRTVLVVNTLLFLNRNMSNQSTSANNTMRKMIHIELACQFRIQYIENVKTQGPQRDKNRETVNAIGDYWTDFLIPMHKWLSGIGCWLQSPIRPNSCHHLWRTVHPWPPEWSPFNIMTSPQATPCNSGWLPWLSEIILYIL